MHKNLLIDAFEKTRNELEREGAKNPSMLQMSTHLSDVLEKQKVVFGPRSLQDHYKQASSIDTEDDINLSVRVIKGLCHYLGYDSYKQYLLENHPSIDNNGEDKSIDKPKRKNRRLTIIISISFVVLIGAFFIYNTTQQKWMVWQGDRYEEVQFDRDELAKGNLKLYKEDRIENFRQILNADCNYQYFNTDGSVRVWYGKSKKGELELFTDIGLHPETGKTLKPITEYMIRKYICETY